MKTSKNKKQIEELSEKEAQKLHDKIKHDDLNIYHQLVKEDAELIALGYTQCQEDMADNKYTKEDIKEMALDFIINTGGLPKNVKDWQNALWKFYESLNKQIKIENKKQTAVEWFAERIQSDKIFSFERVFEKAKEMEKQQIFESFKKGQLNPYINAIEINYKKV